MSSTPTVAKTKASGTARPTRRTVPCGLMFAAIDGAIRAMDRPIASQIVRLPRRRPVSSRGASVACAMFPPDRGTGAPLNHPMSSLPMRSHGISRRTRHAGGFGRLCVGQWRAMTPAVPAQLPPRYANPRPLSAGGMGEILLVDDTLLGRPVVLKLLAETYARDELLRKRFLREANAAARLSGNPHVVTIYDVGEWEGRPFIAMEYLPNGDLHRRMAQGRPPFETSAAWMGEAASALDAAHSSGIVHRDIKPANLLLDARCSVHVADFGIARVVDAMSTAMTMPGTVMGTAGYISPEQARGEPAGGASDIYSLGAVAYELVTGRRPFARDVEADELDAHLHAPLPPASTSPGVPRSADAVFARAMAKSPAERYPTAQAFAD